MASNNYFIEGYLNSSQWYDMIGSVSSEQAGRDTESLLFSVCLFVLARVWSELDGPLVLDPAKWRKTISQSKLWSCLAKLRFRGKERGQAEIYLPV